MWYYTKQINYMVHWDGKSEILEGLEHLHRSSNNFLFQGKDL